MVECWLPYGKTEVHVSVPLKSLMGIAEIKAETAPEPEKEVTTSIQNPIDSKRLVELAAKGKRVALALEGDLPSPYISFAAEQVIAELLATGITGQDISVIVSPSTTGSIGTDLREQVKTLERFGVKITEHSWRQGNVKQVMDWLVNKDFLEADLRVIVGEVKPDSVAGYSGGSSVLFPGLADIRIIESRLRQAFSTEGRFAVLEGNPVQVASREILKVVDVDFAVNIVSDPKGVPIRVFAGAVEKSWRSAVELAEKTYSTKIERGEVVVVSAGGYPYDRTLYRASLAAENALRLRRRDGTVILLAEASEGYGEPSFYKYMTEYKDIRNLERSLRMKWTMGGEAAYRLRKVMEGGQLLLVSMIPDNIARALDIKVSRTASDALNYVNRRAGKELKVAIAPFGSVTIFRA